MAEETERFRVQGKLATAPEYKISEALTTLDVPFTFQYSLWGGNVVRGGVLIDWVIYNPMARPMEHYESHWHSGALGADDKLRLAKIAHYFGVPEVILIFGDEVDGETPQEDVVEIVRRRIGTAL
jgi:hypothetical protein